MKTLLVSSLAAVALIAHVPTCKAESTYRQGEVTVDTFATHTYAMTSPGANLHTHDGTWGYGAGVTYFFHRNFGFEGEAVVLNGRSPSSTSVDDVSFSLIGRAPLGDSGLSPYVLVGAGRNINNGESFAHVGAGLEYRFTGLPVVKGASVFAEGRYQWVRTSTDAAQLRAGLRFTF